jgi:hypothetical protein
VRPVSPIMPGHECIQLLISEQLLRTSYRSALLAAAVISRGM